jgi:hypothetical protein
MPLDAPESTPLPTRIARFVERVPWLIPAISFVSGIVGFVMVKRGAGLARVIAMIALAGMKAVASKEKATRGRKA